MKTLNSIDDVIDVLEEIILESETNNNPIGYFAVLYQKVTKKIKEGIENAFFDDGPRMEHLDVVFAKRYIEAYFAYQQNQKLTTSWQNAFKLASSYHPIVIQHLLAGIHVHISLDLGIAAAEISRGKNIDDLEVDFFRVNDILFLLIEEVQNDLANILPFLKFVFSNTAKVDHFLVDYILSEAREDAWNFAKLIVNKKEKELDALIAVRDKTIARRAKRITKPRTIIKIIAGAIRKRERGSVSEKIKLLRA